LAAFNRELYLCNLLKTDLSLGSSTSEARFYDDFDVRSEASIPLRYGFNDDTHCDDLKKASDPSSPLAVAPALEFSTCSDHSEGSLIIHDSSLPLAPLRELNKGEEFETDASSDDQCGIFVELENIYIKKHSFDEPFTVEFSEVTPHMELIDPISIEYSLDLAPTPPISSLPSSPLFFSLLEALLSYFCRI